MKSLMLAGAEELAGAMLLGLIIVGALLGIFCICAFVAEIWRWVLIARYSHFNKQQASTGLTGKEVAEKLLEGLGITDVSVVKCGFFSAIFVGNSYSPFKKKIKLRKNIFDAKTITAVAIATKLVAMAKRDHDGDKKIKTRSVFTTMGYFAPFAVLPLVLIGILIDVLASQGLGIATIILSCIAVVFYVSSFIVVCLNIPIEKKANADALEFMQKTNLVSAEELGDVKVLYKTYLTMYVLEFITELLYILWRLVKFIGKIFKVFKK